MKMMLKRSLSVVFCLLLIVSFVIPATAYVDEAAEYCEQYGHDIEIDVGRSPTCQKEGITEGEHCARCEEVFVEQTTIGTIPHNYKNNFCTMCNKWKKSGTVKLVSAVNTGNSVKLTWEEYAGADKYRIYKKNGTKWERFTDDVTTLSAEIKGLTNGNTYTFSVRAFRGKEYSNYDKTGITKKYVAKPSKTTGVKATVATYNSVKLSWKKQSGVTGYQIYRDGKKIADIKGASNVTYTDKSLVCGEDYDYKVRARKYDGEKYLYGAFSSEIEITPKPLKTTLSSVTNVSGKKAKLTWKKQSGVTGYQIYRSTDNKTFTKVKDIKGASNVTYTNSSLTKGKTYYYKVRARKYNGEEYVYGSFSSVKSIKISK